MPSKSLGYSSRLKSIKTMENSIEQLKATMTALCPQEAVDLYIGEATRNAMVQLNALREEYGFEPFDSDTLKCERQPGYRELLAAMKGILPHLQATSTPTRAGRQQIEACEAAFDAAGGEF